jgi:hypothetical protein
MSQRRHLSTSKHYRHTINLTTTTSQQPAPPPLEQN